MEVHGKERQVTGTVHDGAYAAESRVQLEIASQCVFHGGPIFGTGGGFDVGDVEIHLSATGFGGRNRQTCDGRCLLIFRIAGISSSSTRQLPTHRARDEQKECSGTNQNQAVFVPGHKFSIWTTDFRWGSGSLENTHARCTQEQNNAVHASIQKLAI